MHGPSNSDPDATPRLLTWSDHNTRGLALASEAAWVEATHAFSGAAEALATENDVASHEALALVLNNLAHSSYRAGQIDDAIAHAQRACALRVALAGEDSIVVSRARADLAVMLSSTGRSDEAMSLVTRAIASIERTAGDESLHLQHVLENAARLAMAAGQPSSAEPYLLRLHALLGAHELPTDRADALLAGVSQHRASARVAFGLMTPAPRQQTVQSVAAETDPIEELTLEETTLEVQSPSTSVLGIDFELVELTPGNSPAVAAPAPVASAAGASNVLGFEVRYGTQIDEEAALTTTIAPPVSVRVPTPQPTRAIAPAVAAPSHDPTPTVIANKPAAQAPSSPQRAAPAADDGARERRIRLPKIRFR